MITDFGILSKGWMSQGEGVEKREATGGRVVELGGAHPSKTAKDGAARCGFSERFARGSLARRHERAAAHN
jgi:hypothetical protein